MLLGCFFTSKMYAQMYVYYFHKVESKNGPLHPLDFTIYNSLAECQVDSVYAWVHYAAGEKRLIDDLLELRPLGRMTYSEDGLVDTLSEGSSNGSYYNVTRFSENNRRLLYLYSGHITKTDSSSYNETFYKYDEEGRLIQITSYRGKSHPDGSRSEEELVNDLYYDYTNLHMTEKGYFYGEFNREYELDSLGRVTTIKNIGNEDKYVEYDGKQYRYDDPYFFYTDSSCIRLGYYYFGDQILSMPDCWVKSEYIFNDKGLLTMEKQTMSIDGVNWAVNNQIEYAYTYLDSKDTYSSTDNAIVEEVNKTKVYGTDNAIIVTTETNTTARIYNVYGQLIVKQNVSSGNNSIYVSKGYYIVTVGNASFKVFVR